MASFTCAKNLEYFRRATPCLLASRQGEDSPLASDTCIWMLGRNPTLAFSAYAKVNTALALIFVVLRSSLQ